MEKLKVNLQIDTDDSVLLEMKKAYENCPEAINYCKTLGIPQDVIDDEIAKVFNFVSDINYCRNCPGIKKCGKHDPLLCNKITYKNGRLDRQLVPCKQLLKRMKIEQIFHVRDFPEEWLDIVLKDVDENKGRKLALSKYVEYLKTGKNDWIYLTGNKNSGRSFFSASLVVDAAKRDKGPIAFLNSTNRIRELNDMSFNSKDEFQRTIDDYCNVPILVLDDFGNEFKNDYVRDAIVLQILSARSNKRLFTIFTSDFKMDEIQVLYSTNKAGEIRAKQLVNILKVMAGKEINLGELSIY